MKITESNLTMASAGHFQARGLTGRAESKNFKDSLMNLPEKGDGMERGFDSFSRRDRKEEESELYDIGFHRLPYLRSQGISVATSFQRSILSLLLSRFHFEGLFGGNYGGVFSGSTQEIVTYEEHEDFTFHADGMARTEDGRVINFNMNIMMSRSYMEYTSLTIPSVQNALCDPLVINLNSSTAEVRDQTFRFDLDSDGHKDNISMLSRGSGFLALDKNGDGKINDGSELFGTKSGDGFRDLRKYDSDGNGWIDENDDVFSKLKVWCKGDRGEDILMNLKEADVGAIFLGSQRTDFSLKGFDGETNAVIRSTGLFLRESTGMAGTVQHVDLALKPSPFGRRWQPKADG